MSEEEFYSRAISFDELGMQVDVFEKEKRKYQQQIDQLTNNWNELEEWLKEWLEEKSEDEFDYAIDDTLRLILDKMKEIKEGNNVSSRD